MKGLFISMLALAALASCSNNDDNAIDAGATKTVRLSLNYGDQTRAIGEIQTAGSPTLTNIVAEYFASADGTGTVAGTKDVTLTGNEATIEVPASINSIRLVANNGKAAVSELITAYQNKNVKTEIPYVGVGKINQAADKSYSATIKLAPAVARIEVSGIVKPAAGATKTVSVIGVYANNYQAKSGDNSLFTLLGASGEVTNAPAKEMYDLKADNTTEWANAFKETGASKCAGYQLFAGSYGVVLQVSIQPATGDAYNKFIVVTSFNDKNGAEINALTAGKIYKLNLSTSQIGKDITDTNDGSAVEDPDKSKSVKVTVEVLDWSEEEVTPNL